MTGLTRRDRLFRAIVRHVDRPLLRLIPSQRVLRVLFGLSSALGTALPRGALMLRRRDGALEVRPAGVARGAPILLYFHGGGFTLGSPRTHAALAGHLAAYAGMTAILPPYRLAPEHPYPAAKDDCIAAYDALIAAGTPPAAICGDSAGGCLALQVACHARDTGAPPPRALGLIAPIADLSDGPTDRFAGAADEMLIPPEWTERIRAAYLPGCDANSAKISPLRGDLSGLPPTLIQASSSEALAADASWLCNAMDDATLDLWEGLPHVWQLRAGRAPAADLAVARMGGWIADRVSA